MEKMEKSRVRALRQARGWSALGLAVQAHVSTATLVAIERWGYVPGPSVRERIAGVLGVGVEVIWPESEPGEAAPQLAERGVDDATR